ncbi:hypothetical protein PanWU01x14_327050 [Parasponia andersonii]|uniref:Uncharacterized protein n=1 Tax=Parasponia andersonii TaxID=3476 RepID=A0A2P5AJB3_PARAD|nr:hypothetical protein PanWU01x14_327050 [Parasponia andersonii]
MDIIGIGKVVTLIMVLIIMYDSVAVRATEPTFPFHISQLLHFLHFVPKYSFHDHDHDRTLDCTTNSISSTTSSYDGNAVGDYIGACYDSCKKNH